MQVAPGERVRIARVDIELEGDARDDPAFRSLLEQLPLRAGAPLHHGEYESAKRSLQNLALRRGYFDAEFSESQVAVDLVDNTAAVALTFASGARYQIGEVRFSETPFREQLLARLTPFEAGEPYEAAKILEFNRRLLDSRRPPVPASCPLPPRSPPASPTRWASASAMPPIPDRGCA